MPRKTIALAVGLFMLVAMAHAGDAAGAGKNAGSDMRVLPAEAKVDGVSFGQWTARWWQWAFAQFIPPYLDRDGRFCDEGQGGPVWFLAGTDGTFTAKRKCVVPAGKHLLVPIINMIYMNPDGGDARNIRPCAALQADAAVNNNHLVSAVVLIDGVAVDNVARYRVRSDGCFPLAAGDATPIAAADGYWLLIKPLATGRHTINIGANYSAGERSYGHMLQNFEYVLDVGGRTDLAMNGDNAEAWR